MKSNAQSVKNYESDWEVVTTNINKGLPATALEVVKKIYTRAKAENQKAQVIKSAIYMSLLQNENRENNIIQSIKDIEKELATSKEPVTAIFNSFLANLYQQYYDLHRYQLYNRTNTINFEKDDIATWTIDDFHQKISALYLRSIIQKQLLQQTKLGDFDAIITKGNTRQLRPTLYDLLAHNALQYFKNDEREISRPAYAFQINQESAFAPAATFIKENFETKDSLSLQHKALLVYQNLIAFHLKDKNPKALIDVDIDRLSYVYNHSVNPQKEAQYYNALKNISEQYPDNPTTDNAQFLMAQWHFQKGRQYDANGDTSNQYEIQKAKQLIDKILTKEKQSEGWVNAYNLNNQIITPKFSFEVEKVNIPNEPFRMLVKYSNVSKIHLRIIAATGALKKAVKNEDGKNHYWNMLANATPLKSWIQPLPENTDYQNHSAEIKIDALPKGEYFILTSINSDFQRTVNILGLKLTYISDISYVNNQNDFFVLHRNNGQPLANAKVKVWQKKYNYQTYKYSNSIFANYTTDNNGYFLLANNDEEKRGGNVSYLFEITHDKDKLFIDEEDAYRYYNYNSYRINNSKENIQVFLFTDRSIYRPGQTVYLKGIAINKQNDGKKATVLNKYNSTVIIYDANYQKVDSIKIESNEYGSFNGKFNLPQSGLNGIFRIEMNDRKGSTHIRMEEYKRPKFFVDFEKIKGTYKVDENIAVIGFAKAYAGNTISNASVKYRVVREARYPYPWMFWRGWWPRSSPQEITNGEVTTDDSGKFVITFKAIPDLNIDPKTEPVFDYKIYADVTDLNGEVRSGDETVSVGYKSLLLKVNIAEKVSAADLKQISIRTENMAGNFEKATVKINISQLKTEQRLLRTRYWNQPDQFVMSKAEYIQNFPNDIYNNEDEPKTWAIENKVHEQTITTDSTGKVLLSNIALSPGFYIIETSTVDKDGQSVIDKQYVEIFDERNNAPAYPQYLLAKNPKPIEPGEKTSIGIGSSAKDVFLVQCINKPNANYSFLKLNKNNRNIEFGATEADRGGYGVNYMFVKNNRVFQSNNTIAVPWSNKALSVSYQTFRDKTLPGAEEKWTVKISGNKNEKVAAEMLASMYDASLDQFAPHQWNQPGIWNTFYNNTQWNSYENFTSSHAMVENSNRFFYKDVNKRYDQPIWSQYFYGSWGGPIGLRGRVADIAVQENEAIAVADAGKGIAMAKMEAPQMADSSAASIDATPDNLNNAKAQQGAETAIRKNFNETAFFFPDLKTDADGNISFSFTMPEALTRWKFQALVHTKDLAMGYSSKEIVTQKDLMVQPNAPRFLREGDKMEFSSKVVNLSDKEITGTATLQLFDAASNEPVDGWFKNVIPQQYFTIAAGQSQAVNFPIEVPYQYNKALTWRIVAKTTENSGTASLSDGEENMLPVLTNRMLVTESLPLQMRGSGTKKFSFDKLLKSGNSETLSNQSLTVEYTSNPAWYAVQALPYMMEYPYDCAEQTWNRYYANSLATVMANSSPKIKQVFEQWRTEDTAALMSNLQKNQELKSALLEETPWVLQAQSEAQQKKNIAVLFDLMRMSKEMNSAYEKLKQMQSPNGGFVWFKGGRDDRYMTQYIVTGIGHLKKLNAIEKTQSGKLNGIVNAALPYLDRKIKEEYEQLLQSKINLNQYIPSYYVVQYLYMRSFFPETKIAANAQKAVTYFTQRAKLTWVSQNKYMQAMLALALYRSDDAATPKAILKSLKETAVNNDELGMYYNDAARSWWWYQAPIERQAIITEAFEEAGKDTKTADDLRTWLLKNKQTNNWESTKATAEAVYALLLRGSDWLTVSPEVTIDLGGLKIESQLEKTEAGTGYMKKTIPAEKVRPQMGNISLTVNNKTNNTLPTWGSIYWQYFEDLDKITFAATPLSLNKKLFVEKNTDNGPVLQPVNENDVIKVGDKIKVRIELRTDRDMEYMHMKDMRASAFEPVNVLSTYKWQGGLGYYETTKDASTNFFFGYLPKGTYVFEYNLFATVAGNFSNGITTIQCMYAPEFTSHSEGIRVNIK
ncbi:MAG: alpha-2-macroglobulin family protein [Niabella sp.]